MMILNKVTPALLNQLLVQKGSIELFVGSESSVRLHVKMLRLEDPGPLKVKHLLNDFEYILKLHRLRPLNPQIRSAHVGSVYSCKLEAIS